MANEVARLDDRRVPVTTPAGAQALRQIACSAAWNETTASGARRWLGPRERAALPAARIQAEALLAPATRGDFKRLVSPTLALVAPVGMSEADQAVWLHTAAETLSGIPSDLLEIGCMAARRTVDHYSKIVAAIFAEIESTWEARRRDLAGVRRLQLAVDGPAPNRPSVDQCTPEQAAAILAGLGMSLSTSKPQPAGPLRAPTREETAGIMREMGLPSASPAPGEDRGK